MITVPEVQRFKQEGRRFAMLTAYDYHTARILDQAEIPLLLVGDSLGMVMLGYETTIPVTVEEMLHHCRAVARGAKNALLVGDLPFMSYESSPEQAMATAGRMLKEGGMQAVKLEGGMAVVETVRRLAESGIPVMGHLGLTPQKFHQLGGFKAQGKTRTAAEQILADACQLEQAGAFSLVLEAVPAELAKEVTASLRIPTVGIVAGPHCDGQILAFHDMVGLSPRVPKFVKQFGNLAADVERMARQYAREVGEGNFPSAEHFFSSPQS
ncbi:MAG: 3-methyl-2-oxobutanoate hydroxymethyltransferase [Candidatus Dormibacteraceae bacterium]